MTEQPYVEDQVSRLLLSRAEFRRTIRHVLKVCRLCNPDSKRADLNTVEIRLSNAMRSDTKRNGRFDG